MRKIIFVLFLVFATVARAEHPAPVVPSLTVLQGFVLDEQPEATEIAASIKAIEPEHTNLTSKRRLRIAEAILYAAKKTKVDPIMLTSVIRVESDFQRIFRLWPECKDPSSNSCRADCGISQHHLSGPKKWVLRRCKFYTRNMKACILKSAKEIAHHVKYCQTRSRDNVFERCVLNRYNGGPFYKRRYRCRRKQWRCMAACPKDKRLYNERATCLRKCTRASFRCRTIANYWRRVLCFDYGARNKLRPVKNCRNVWSLKKVPAKFYAVDTQAD